MKIYLLSAAARAGPFLNHSLRVVSLSSLRLFLRLSTQPHCVIAKCAPHICRRHQPHPAALSATSATTTFSAALGTAFSTAPPSILAFLASRRAPTGRPCRGRSWPAFWGLQAGSMRTGRPSEATLSNATVLQLLQAIELRVTAAFWFEAHQKSLRVAEANARGKQALQSAVEHVVVAAKCAVAATVATAERFADAIAAADAAAERAAHRLVEVAVAAPGRAADLYLSVAVAAAECAIDAVKRVAVCTGVATLLQKRVEAQRKQALHSGDESGDEGDVVGSADEAEGEDVDGLFTVDKEEVKMTESQKIIAAFEVELESENAERAFVASIVSEITRIEKVEAAEASIVSEVERTNKLEAERRDESFFSSSRRLIASSRVGFDPFPPGTPSEAKVEDLLPTLPWRSAAEIATLVKEAAAVTAAAAEAEAVKAETAHAAAMAAGGFDDPSNVYSPLVSNADTDTDTEGTDTEESVDDATTVLRPRSAPAAVSAPAPAPNVALLAPSDDSSPSESEEEGWLLVRAP